MLLLKHFHWDKPASLHQLIAMLHPKVVFILVVVVGGWVFVCFFVPTVAGRFFHNGPSIPPTHSPSAPLQTQMLICQ